ncbi:M20/M25/M40 family metallo-hydrolase [Paenibacillus wulumuqiensis]|uniref:M20/M25/M40 family metallo-hydrolase n=1 Tax=Paenibacillus wulumuqiensis TaxID=1567107 RepID=UPI0006191FD3|nr:M20/M25/M40 family metallo-hydrolase [Paenibacillus wulumuqiensis]
MSVKSNRPVISGQVQQIYERLTADPNVQAGLQFLEQDHDRTIEEQIELTEIEAPTFDETAKGEVYKRKLEQLGIQNVTVDETGNVFGLRRGSGDGPSLVVCAHLDTVFPAGTDVKAKHRDGRIYAPGIADDGRGLAVVLTIARALQHTGIRSVGDLIIGATVGEEGLGDLRGVKALFTGHSDIDGFISVEPGEPERITYLAAGSKRYKVTFHGTGGHSFADFGIPNPIHALGRAIAGIAEIRTPAEPKTTFSVGVVEGGTSVNTIAEEAALLLDMRSSSAEALAELEQQALSIIHQAAHAENARWNREDELIVKLELVGDRPAGEQSADAIIVQAAAAANQSMRLEPELEDATSTDSNVAISLGIPAVTLGGGGDYGGMHTLDEYFDPAGAYLGAQYVFLVILGLVGLDGVTPPLLSKRK